MFREGAIDGVIFRDLSRYEDPRGWLVELYREDDVPAEYHPVMGYVSMTLPGVARGPHEHRDQADLFCFLGPSSFKLYLWDNREESLTYRCRQAVVVGRDNPQAVIIPPGVVHAYKNVGDEHGLVYNLPNRLYRGPGRKEEVDEIRHEDVTGSPYVLD
jgi:dTDP-4-dehydrorhamnose 3,5-epimerase